MNEAVKQLTPILGLLLFSSLSSAQSHVYSFHGDDAFDRFGWSAGFAGDLNKDGFDDILIGAERDDDGAGNAGSARVLSGYDGSILFSWNGFGPADHFGVASAAAGDVDNDTYPDVIVGAPLNNLNGNDAGRVRVFSGFDGTEIWEVRGSAAGDQFGCAVSGAGDVNCDGFDDFLVGASQANTGLPGYVRLFSGIDGSVIRTIEGPGPSSEFGISVVGGADIDGDTIPDFLAGAWIGGAANEGVVLVMSGASDVPIHTLSGDSGFDFFGWSVGIVGDLTGDDQAEFVVGAYGDDNLVSEGGSVRVFNGDTGLALYTVHGDSVFGQLGWSVAGAGDLSCDGTPDVIVGAPFDGNGIARGLDGIDGSELFTITGDDSSELFGRSVRAAGDVNGDGEADWVAGAPLDDDNGSNSGSARVYSGKTLLMAADEHLLSLSAGGTVTFTLEAGASAGSFFYSVWGSGTGTTPGTPVGNVTVPLNFDPYFRLTLFRPFFAPFGNFFSTLSPTGSGTASLTIPPGSDPGLHGVILHHAFVSAEVLGQVDFASNAVPVTLTL